MTHDDRHAAASAIEAALTDGQFERSVEMVVRPLGDHRFRAASVDGSVEFRRDPLNGAWAYSVESTVGRDPLADQATDRFDDLAVEVAALFPHRATNAYPHAFDSISQVFDSPHAPDLIATHTAAHHVGGMVGQHGNLGVVQARAPFIAAGSGVRADGLVDRSTRTVDIAATVAQLLGVDRHPNGVGPTGERRGEARLARQDGDPDTRVLTGDRADHVVVLLLDGCNANLLRSVIDSGDAPRLASIAGRGTHYRHGTMASLPTATLANHTTALTGAHPGHSGIIHNTWFNRASAEEPDLLDLGQMFWSSNHIADDVETVFEAIHRTRPDAFTAALFEYADRGATWSSFDVVRGGAMPDLPGHDELAHADREATSASPMYLLGSQVDELSFRHAVELWDGTHGNPLPELTWVDVVLTDEAGHASGPHGELARQSILDTDARVGDLLQAVEAAGALDRTAVVVIGDHGMEQSDPQVDESWAPALSACGVPVRDVGGGFLYLG